MVYSIDTEKYIDRMASFVKRVTGFDINLKNPVTINDKLCWLNIYEPMKLKTKCADKILLHDYCKEKLGVDLCVPIIKVYNHAGEIKWDELPERFVMKCNHGSGMNIIVKDKSKLDIHGAMLRINKWMNWDFSMANGFEAHYHDIERKIFVEEYIEQDGDIPKDYKFLCFNGEPKYVEVIGNRFNSGKYMNYYDMDFNFQIITRNDFHNNPNIHDEKPKCFEQMKEFARKLSDDFKFVRVDFYEIDGKIYIGELTFTPGAFVFTYKDPNDHLRVGNMLKI